jgi:hypothetical protein
MYPQYNNNKKDSGYKACTGGAGEATQKRTGRVAQVVECLSSRGEKKRLSLEAEKQPGKLDSAHSSLRFTEEKLLRELC